jgi:hypothetical protein
MLASYQCEVLKVMVMGAFGIRVSRNEVDVSRRGDNARESLLLIDRILPFIKVLCCMRVFVNSGAMRGS